jgi:hypothetical protein
VRFAGERRLFGKGFGRNKPRASGNGTQVVGTIDVLVVLDARSDQTLPQPLPQVAGRWSERVKSGVLRKRSGRHDTPTRYASFAAARSSRNALRAPDSSASKFSCQRLPGEKVLPLRDGSPPPRLRLETLTSATRYVPWDGLPRPSQVKVAAHSRASSGSGFNRSAVSTEWRRHREIRRA